MFGGGHAVPEVKRHKTWDDPLSNPMQNLKDEIRRIEKQSGYERRTEIINVTALPRTAEQFLDGLWQFCKALARACPCWGTVEDCLDSIRDGLVDYPHTSAECLCVCHWIRDAIDTHTAGEHEHYDFDWCPLCPSYDPPILSDVVTSSGAYVFAEGDIEV